MRRTMDEVLESLRHARERKTRISVLIGAGCSVTAGIPLASGFVKEIEKEYPHAYARADKKTYPALMGALTRGERRDLIFKYIDDAKINWAHIALAQLVGAGVIERILTVNFDPLVIRACALVGIYPAVYDFGASQRFTPGAVVDPSVFYLHGQRSGFVILNTDDEVNYHASLLTPVFQDAGRARLWLVVGYSGDNDPVFKQLAAIPFFDHGLYWIGYNDAEPSKDVREQLLEAGKDAFYVNGLDADEFFVKLAQELGCFPPDMVAKPFTHLNNTLQKVAPYRFSKLSEPVDILEHARKYITTAADKIEPAQADGLQAWSDLIGGDFNAVIALREKYSRDLHPDLADAIAWAYLGQGKELIDDAAAQSGVEADALRERAAEKYAEAVRIKPDMHEAFYNWGSMLDDWARTKTSLSALALRKVIDGSLLDDWAQTKSGAEADALRERAAEKYTEAVRIKPDMHEAFNNWGNLLMQWAQTKTGVEAEALRERADAKYAEAVRIKPDDHAAFNNWGNLLMQWARTKTDAEADALRERAEEKYAEAVRIKPDMHEAFNNWGLLLMQWAQVKSDAEADELRERADAKYAQAMRIKPDDHAAFYNWGILYLNWYRDKTDAEAREMLTRAESVLLRAESVKLGSGSYNLACVYALKGDEAACRKYLIESKESNDLPSRSHLEQDEDLDPIRATAWFQEFLAALPPG